MRSTVAATIAIVLAIAATTASAGVVVTQDVVFTDQAGKEHKSEMTVMLQGNKERIVTADRVIVTDLDLGRMFSLLPKSKDYGEIPFPPLGPIVAVLGRQGWFVNYDKATGTGKVAGYDCQNYTGTWTSGREKVEGKECVANAAAGAKEFVAFRKAMADRLKSTPLKFNGDIPDGIPVSSTFTSSIIPTKIPPGFPPDQVAKIKEEQAKLKPEVRSAKVTKIEVKDLEPALFVVPMEFRNLLPPKPLAPGSIPKSAGAGTAQPGAKASPAAH